MDEADQDAVARAANAADLWDGLWSRAGSREWRAEALRRVYDRIISLVRPQAQVVDVGGGVGALAERLAAERRCTVTVLDHSQKALEYAAARGVWATHRVDLENLVGGFADAYWRDPHARKVIVGTEVLEHLTAGSRASLLWDALAATTANTEDEDGSAFFSVPNNRLGPDEEPQHTTKFTAREFGDMLRCYYANVRVEVLGPYLLGVCGRAAQKRLRLSVCLPVRDEARDLEATLASFRGVADELVVGVDPRTTDNTWEVARCYADVVFSLEDPACQDPGNPLHVSTIPATGVHFAWIRNQCVDRCTGDWVFMTEGHERLYRGQDTLLAFGDLLGGLAIQPDVAFVWRQGGQQRWGYPWLFRRARGFRYERAVHNELRYPDDTPAIKLPQVVTMHSRHATNAHARARQRKAQNRTSLIDDWTTNANAASLFYFAQEVRADDPDGAIARYEEFLSLDRARASGLTRYQARLELARLYAGKQDVEGARQHLLLAASDDWSRTEHWLWLGDLAFGAGHLEEALQYYRYAGTVVVDGEPPFTLWWVDLAHYSYLPAQRLAMCYGHLGQLRSALEWARRVAALLPPDAPAECFAEAAKNVKMLEEVLAA